MAAQPLELFYSVQSVAVLLGGRSVRWVQEMIRRGEFGPCVHDSGGWLVPSSGVAAYLGRHTVGVPQPVAVRFGRPVSRCVSRMGEQ